MFEVKRLLSCQARHGVLWLFLGLLMQNNACSGLLNWSPEGLACEQDTANNVASCAEGYLCLSKQAGCVPNNSQKVGENCIVDTHCQSGLVCPSNLQSSTKLASCVQACDPCLAYYQSNVCPQGYVCEFVWHRTGSSLQEEPSPVGACLLGILATPGQNCTLSDQSTGISVLMNNDGTTACVPSCEIDFTQYVPRNNCGSLTASCQPIGLLHYRALACIEHSDLPQLSVNDACPNFVQNACPTDTICVSDNGNTNSCTQQDQDALLNTNACHCRSYCKRLLQPAATQSSESDCPNGFLCCDYGDDLPSNVGICMPESNACFSTH